MLNNNWKMNTNAAKIQMKIQYERIKRSIRKKKKNVIDMIGGSGVAGARLTPHATTAADGTGSLSGSGSTTGTGTGTASASALALAPLRYACAAPDPAKPRPGV
ncbi:hypothetical protein HZH68_007754 [Vespula germanica]|uniref:Uncharacterized protein n=1 Tax=Vespula germanica TaxID=30212 RepID=A0A834K4B9_VESGE|nr:hypothetical protein HZH68_007754 [Vespula germanica]